MLHFFVRLLVNACGVMIVAHVVPGVQVRGFGAAVFAAIVIGFVNAIVRPILEILSFPITLLTLGLFSLIVNAFLFWLASAFVPGFTVLHFSAAFWGSLVFWLVSWVTNTLIHVD